jgi:hypothetical protein
MMVAHDLKYGLRCSTLGVSSWMGSSTTIILLWKGLPRTNTPEAVFLVMSDPLVNEL